MTNEIELRREELRKICHCFNLRRLDFFGSAARGHLKAERR
jgi:predicted nucleotidyltransferase